VFNSLVELLELGLHFKSQSSLNTQFLIDFVIELPSFFFFFNEINLRLSVENFLS